MYSIHVFSLEYNEWVVKSSHRTPLAADANFDVVKASGVPVRLILEGLIVNEANTERTT